MLLRFYGPSGETRLHFCLEAEIIVATSVCTGGSNMPPAYCICDLRVSLSKEKCRHGVKPFLHFWSEWRDSNSRHLHPNRVIIFFLTFLSPFGGFYSERSCFPELSVPLFPGVRILPMVKYVVKSKHSPKGFAFRGVLISSEVS